MWKHPVGELVRTASPRQRDLEATMRGIAVLANMIAALMIAALGTAAWVSSAVSQERGQPGSDTQIEREKLSLAGWDADEPVPAYAYYKKGNPAMPVVIFMHGLGGSKEQDPQRMRDLAGKGFFVVAI